jgi:hypothetical protein
MPISPGEWRLANWPDHKGQSVIRAHDPSSYAPAVALVPYPGDLANARLIAAAPDLFDALRLVREELEAMSGQWTERMATLAQLADAALAKVEDR